MEGCLGAALLLWMTYQVTNLYMVNGVLATIPEKKTQIEFLAGGACGLCIQFIILAS